MIKLPKFMLALLGIIIRVIILIGAVKKENIMCVCVLLTTGQWNFS